MLTLAFSYSDKHTVYFSGFMDEDSIVHQPKEISLFYPGIGVTDIEIIGKKRLKEIVQAGFYHSKPDSFYMDFDGK